jgi:hypothetical protein
MEIILIVTDGIIVFTLTIIMILSIMVIIILTGIVVFHLAGLTGDLVLDGTVPIIMVTTLIFPDIMGIITDMGTGMVMGMVTAIMEDIMTMTIIHTEEPAGLWVDTGILLT